MIKIAILASGSGTNAENLINYFRNSDVADIALVATNNPEAGVIERAKRLNTPVLTFNRAELNNGQLLMVMKEQAIDMVVLAGFLWLVPENLIKAFPNRIVNIHPALLPNYGGKGMYGHHVHNAVIAKGESESGITIHIVDEHYDEGDILFQAKTEIVPGDTAETLAGRIHQLEYRHFPEVVEQMAKRLGQEK